MRQLVESRQLVQARLLELALAAQRVQARLLELARLLVRALATQQVRARLLVQARLLVLGLAAQQVQARLLVLGLGRKPIAAAHCVVRGLAIAQVVQWLVLVQTLAARLLGSPKLVGVEYRLAWQVLG